MLGRSPLCASPLCDSVRVSRTFPQRFDHRIVKRRTYLFDGLVLAVRPGSVGEQSYGKLALRIDPQRCAGVTEVTEGTGRKVFSGLRGRRGRIPAQSTGSACGRGFPARKQFDSRERRMGRPPLSMAWAKMARSSAVENRPACPATPPSTLAFSSCTSPWMMRWRKVRSSAVGGMELRQRWRGIESRVSHAERTEDFALAEHVERFVGEALERDARE